MRPKSLLRGRTVFVFCKLLGYENHREISRVDSVMENQHVVLYTGLMGHINTGKWEESSKADSIRIRTNGEVQAPFENFSNSWISPFANVLVHYNDVIMNAMASQITSLTIVYSTVYSGADQRKHHSSASLAFVRGIHRWPVNSPHKWPVSRKNVAIWWRHHIQFMNFPFRKCACCVSCHIRILVSRHQSNMAWQHTDNPTESR